VEKFFPSNKDLGMQKPERSKNLGCGFVDGSMDGSVVKGGKILGQHLAVFFWGGEGRKWYLGFRVWCWLRLVEVGFSVVCCFLYVFVGVSVVLNGYLP